MGSGREVSEAIQPEYDLMGDDENLPSSRAYLKSRPDFSRLFLILTHLLRFQG